MAPSFAHLPPYAKAAFIAAQLDALAGPDEPIEDPFEPPTEALTEQPAEAPISEQVKALPEEPVEAPPATEQAPEKRKKKRKLDASTRAKAVLRAAKKPKRRIESDDSESTFDHHAANVRSAITPTAKPSKSSSSPGTARAPFASSLAPTIASTALPFIATLGLSDSTPSAAKTFAPSSISSSNTLATSNPPPTASSPSSAPTHVSLTRTTGSSPNAASTSSTTSIATTSPLALTTEGLWRPSPLQQTHNLSRRGLL